MSSQESDTKGLERSDPKKDPYYWFTERELHGQLEASASLLNGHLASLRHTPTDEAERMVYYEAARVARSLRDKVNEIERAIANRRLNGEPKRDPVQHELWWATLKAEQERLIKQLAMPAEQVSNRRKDKQPTQGTSYVPGDEALAAAGRKDRIQRHHPCCKPCEHCAPEHFRVVEYYL